MSLLRITLYSIYWPSFKKNITRSAGLFSLSTDISLWSNGLMMNSTPQNTRSSLPISLLSSSLLSNGTGYFGTSTTASVMAKPWSPSKPRRLRTAPFLKILYALFVGLPISISTIILAAADIINGEKITTPLKLQCSYCGHTLHHVKDRKHFHVHKCVKESCSYYKRNLKKLPEDLPTSEYRKYKLRYLYREFSVNFYDMALNRLSK